ncbi:MAG: hypothetical protein JXB47_20760 [Anaerolineae bacterium]|nr:hypothetical protein [Anaerolineae bacterium]
MSTGLSTEIAELLPEIHEIRDEALRVKVGAVWADAMQQSGFTAEDVARMPFTLLAENVPVSFIEHVRTVCKMCIAVAGVLSEAYGARSNIDRDVLIAGALLADVGKLFEYEDDGTGGFRFAPMYQYLRHPFSGVGLCWKHDIPPAVLHVIATHSWEGEKFKRRPESIIFHHADFIDFDLVKTK